MAPRIEGFDHIHVYVGNRAEAEQWYDTVLGFKPVEALMLWADKTGPLTIENPEGTVHLALFERDNHPATSAIAFAVSGQNFLTWKVHLEARGLDLRITDHQLAWSLYFRDPWQNLHEITTMDYAEVTASMHQA